MYRKVPGYSSATKKSLQLYNLQKQWKTHTPRGDATDANQSQKRDKRIFMRNLYSLSLVLGRACGRMPRIPHSKNSVRTYGATKLRLRIFSWNHLIASKCFTYGFPGI